MEQVKTVVLLILRWSLKFVGPWLVAQGVGEEAYIEVAAGVVMFLVGIVISLFQRKKDLATPPPA